MTLHPLLARQLAGLGARAGAVPSAEEWRLLLDQISRAYEASDRDRYLVERSLDICSAEMGELYEQLRRSSESELAAERDRLRTVIESVGDGLCVVDADGAIVFANPEARRLLDRPDRELVGRRLREVLLIRDGADPAIGTDARLARHRGDDAVFECADGRSFPASYVLNPTAEDASAGFVLVFRDMTHPKRAEQELRRQRDYAAALVASMEDGLTVIAPDGVITEVSPSFCAMTGFSREEIVGARPPYPYWPEVDLEKLARGFRRIDEEGSGEWDLEFRRPDGGRFPVILTASALSGEGPAAIGYLGTVKDVTDRKRAETVLARSEAENRQLAAEQAALRRVATAIASEAEPAAVFSLIAREAAGLLGVEFGLVARFEDDRALPLGWWAAEQDALDMTFPLRGQGGLAQVHRHGHPARVDDYGALEWDPIGRIALAGRYRGSVAAPVRVAGRVWGGVLASTTGDEPIAADAEKRLEHFAELAALAVANADARARITNQHRELQDRAERLEHQRAELRDALAALRAEKERLESFYRFGERVASETSLARVAEEVLAGVCAFAGADGGALHAGEPSPDGRLPLAAVVGTGQVWGSAISPGEGAARRALFELRTVEAPPEERGALHVPLVHGGRALGVVTLVRRRRDPLGADDVAAIEHLCSHAAMALANALSLRRVQRQAETNRAVLETAYDASIAVDRHGVIVGWNPQAERIFGLPRAVALGRPFPATVIPPGPARGELDGLLAGRFESLLDRRLEREAVRADGDRFPVELTIARIPQGEGAGLHVFARDVSSRKRAEHYVAAQHAVTRVLAESGTAEEARPALLRSLGEGLGCVATALWTVDAALGRLGCAGVWAASPAAGKALAASLEGIAIIPGAGAAGRAWITGEPALAAAGADDPLAVVLDAKAGIPGVLCMPIRGEDGVSDVIALMGPCAIAPPEELLDTLRIIIGQLGQFFARKRAEREADRVKDEFVALVSHELRTPLTSILGYLEMLADGESGPLLDQQRRFVAVVDRNARRLLRLVGDLLFIAQLESGEFRLQAADSVDLPALAADALYAARPMAEERDIALTVSCPASPIPALRGDRDRISQVFDNLISNGLKFTGPGGGVDVRLLDEGDHVVIEVADTGIGISEGDQERLFRRFFRASAANQRQIPGVGLGLSIVRAIVHAHGGTIDLRSDQGKGTVFRVSLPVAAQPWTAGRERPPAAHLTA